MVKTNTWILQVSANSLLMSTWRKRWGAFQNFAFGSSVGPDTRQLLKRTRFAADLVYVEHNLAYDERQAPRVCRKCVFLEMPMPSMVASTVHHLAFCCLQPEIALLVILSLLVPTSLIAAQQTQSRPDAAPASNLAITLPQPISEVHGVIDIVGTAAIAGMAFYRLSAITLNNDQSIPENAAWIPLTTDLTTPVTNSKLATIEATKINGNRWYEINNGSNVWVREQDIKNLPSNCKKF
jgi:hypothetical protein